MIRPDELRRLLVVGAAYVATARLGLAVEPVGGFATLVWPPTGIALAAVLVWGQRMSLAVVVGAALVNLWVGAPPLVALAMGLGNGLEAASGARVLRAIPGFRPSLDRVVDVIGFVAVAGGCTTVSATIGTASLFVGGVVERAAIGPTWWAWWVGDALGALVVAPLLLTLRPPELRPASRWLEGTALTAVLVGVGGIVFGDIGTVALPLRHPYVLSVVLLWAALRFGQPGVARAMFGIAAVAVGGTLLGHGPFGRPSVAESLLFLQAFLATFPVTFLVFGAVIAERTRVSDERAVLARASAGLLDPVDPAALVEATARVALPTLGDRCLVEVVQPDGSVGATRVCVGEGDPTEAARASVTVPLGEQGRVRGAMTFATASDRAYDEVDRALAGELASRLALAIDRARLHADLQRAVRVRDETLAIVSHDLRNPLGTIALSAKLLLREAPVAVHPVLEVILRSTERMDRLIADLRDASILEAGPLSVDPKPHDACAIARQAVEAFAAAATAKGLHLAGSAPAEPVSITCDRDRIHQVLSNLIGNAIGLTSDGGSVTVELSATEREVSFVVRDTGPGLAPEHVGRIFERHWRAPGARRPGAGLGLFIASGIVRAHRGTIRVESAPGRGSTFSVVLPRDGPVAPFNAAGPP